jgi:hypothetical protein
VAKTNSNALGDVSYSSNKNIRTVNMSSTATKFAPKPQRMSSFQGKDLMAMALKGKLLDISFDNREEAALIKSPPKKKRPELR